MSLDERESHRNAIAGRKTLIERINRNIDRLYQIDGTRGQFGGTVRVSQQAIARLIQQRLHHEAGLAELEADDKRALEQTINLSSRRRTENDRPNSTKLLTVEEEQTLAQKIRKSASYPTLSIKEVAMLFSKSESTIYRWVETGKLQSSRVAGRVLMKSVKILLKARKDK